MVKKIISLLLLLVFFLPLTSCNTGNDTPNIPSVTPSSVFNYCSLAGAPDKVSVCDNSGFIGEEVVIKKDIVVDGKSYVVDNIATYAFQNNPYLKKLTIEDGINYISYNAFENCINLEEVIIGKGLETVGDAAFLNCVKLKSVTLGEDVKNLNRAAFSKTGLESITFNDNLEFIGIDCFFLARNLKTLNFNDQLKFIGGSAFERCESLVSVTFGTKLKTISNYAFNKTKITEVKLYGVETIGDYAFANAKITNAEIDAKYIGKRAFYNNPGLKTLTLNNTVEILAEAFKKSKIASVALPDTLVSIYDQAFGGISSLKEITFGSSLERIGFKAFAGTGVKEIVLPQSLAVVYPAAFSGCSNLRTVNIYYQTIYEASSFDSRVTINTYGEQANG